MKGLSADTSTDGDAWAVAVPGGSGAAAAASPNCAWTSTLDGKLCVEAAFKGVPFCRRHLCRSAGCDAGVPTDQDSCASCKAKYT